jgi:tetratricopeptide (TPR) repeat protein
MVFGKLNNLFKSYVSKNVKAKASKDFFESCSVYGYDLRDHADTLHNKGLEFLAAADYEQAEEYFQKALKIIPDNLKVHLSVGIINLGRKEYEEAAAKFSEVLEQDPDFVDARLYLAEAYLKLGKFGAAIKEFNCVARDYKSDEDIEKKLLNAYYQYGNRLRKNKDYKNAINKYKNAARYDNRNPQLYYALGLCYKDMRQDQEAMDYFDLALNFSKDAKKPPLYQQIAEIYERKKESAKAIDFYNKALDYEQSSALKSFYKGKIFFNKKYYDAAIKNFTAAVEISADFLKGLFSLAETYEVTSDYDKAIAAYEQVLLQDKDNTGARINIAINNYRQGNKNEAFVKLLNFVQDIGSESALAHKYLGIILMEKENTDEAIIKFSKAIALEPSDLELYLYLSACYRKQDDLKTAIKTAAKALQLEPESPEGLKNLAQLYFESANTNKSLELFEKLLQITPNDQEIYLALAKIYQRSAEYQKAVHYYKKYLFYTSDDQASLNMAISYFELEKYPEAKSVLESLKNKGREIGAPASYYLCKIFHKQAKLIKAREYIERCIDLNSNYFEGWLQAGKVYYELSELARAIDSFEAALKIEPENSEAMSHFKNAHEKFLEQYGFSYE